MEDVDKDNDLNLVNLKTKKSLMDGINQHLKKMINQKMEDSTLKMNAEIDTSQVIDH